MDKVAFERMVTNLTIFVKQSSRPMSAQCREKAGIAIAHDKKLARILVDLSKSHQELEDHLNSR